MLRIRRVREHWNYAASYPRQGYVREQCRQSLWPLVLGQAIVEILVQRYMYLWNTFGVGAMVSICYLAIIVGPLFGWPLRSVWLCRKAIAQIIWQLKLLLCDWQSLRCRHCLRCRFRYGLCVSANDQSESIEHSNGKCSDSVSLHRPGLRWPGLTFVNKNLSGKYKKQNRRQITKFFSLLDCGIFIGFLKHFSKPVIDGRLKGNVFAWQSNCTLRGLPQVGKFICEPAGEGCKRRNWLKWWL